MDEDTFKLIYAQFFPQGGESEAIPRALLPAPPEAPTSSCGSSAEGGCPFIWRGPSPSPLCSPHHFPWGLGLPLSHWKGNPSSGHRWTPSMAAWVGDFTARRPQDTPTSALAPPDATTYAHFLFNAFDADGNGAICFEVGLCCTLPHPLQLARCPSALVPHPRVVERAGHDPGVHAPECPLGNGWTVLDWPWT